MASGSSTSLISTRDTFTPQGVGEAVDDLLKLAVDLVAVDQQLVELDLADEARPAGSGECGSHEREPSRPPVEQQR